MKCCFIWLLVITSIIATILGIYIFIGKSDLKIIIPCGLIILVLGITASVLSYKNNSLGKEFKSFYDNVISIKNIDDSAKEKNYLSESKIELLKLYSELLKEQ